MNLMGRTVRNRDRLLIVSAVGTALGILGSLSPGHHGFASGLACVAFGLTCLAIHRTGRRGGSLGLELKEFGRPSVPLGPASEKNP